MGRPRTELAARFWSKVKRGASDECWEWQASRCGVNRAYGQFYVDGIKIVAHRVAWTLNAGLEPLPHLEVCHSCDNGACCNPAHLWLGTHKQNMEDKAQKGRSNVPSGSKTKQAKLTEEKVLIIKGLIASGTSQRTIAKQFGVSQPAISYINKNICWAHLSQEKIA